MDKAKNYHMITPKSRVLSLLSILYYSIKK